MAEQMQRSQTNHAIIDMLKSVDNGFRQKQETIDDWLFSGF